jgi:hypothetical protein
VIAACVVVAAFIGGMLAPRGDGPLVTPGEGGTGGAAVSMARWVNTRGEKGPWSDVTAATVAA